MFKLNSILKQNFIDLICQHTGIRIKDNNNLSLDNKILIRIKALHLSPEEYYNLLSSFRKESEQEWKNLMILLTNLESYFFRDKEQLNLIRNHVIPELIKELKYKKRLRICSAGCSTGQEPYSLAIILKEIMPDLTDWNILIWGLDINEKALNLARQGVYSNWSFRKVEEDLKNKYFVSRNNQYHLNNEIKKMVTFKHINLVKDLDILDNLNLPEMDLILCRNVFIYFEPKAINKVVSKFYQMLRPNGYLITGHAEIMGKSIDYFNSKIFPESIVYQRPLKDQKGIIYFTDNKEKNNDLLQKNLQFQFETKVDLTKNLNYNNQEKSLNLTVSNAINNQKFAEKTNSFETVLIKKDIPKETPTKKEENQEYLLTEAENLFIKKSYNLALKKLQYFLGKKTENIKAYELISKIYANEGEYEKAIKYCEKALKIDSFDIIPHYILSEIAQEKNEIEEAKRLLKKIIYLDPNFLPAYLNLSSIYKQQKDFNREAKMTKVALNIINKLPLNTKIPELGNITIKDLKEKLED